MAIDIQAPAPRTLPALQSTPSSEDRPSLPSLGFDISRPSSTSTQASSHYSQLRIGGNPTVQLPALSTLASIASIASTAPPAEASTSHGYVHERGHRNLDTKYSKADRAFEAGGLRQVQRRTPVFGRGGPRRPQLPTSSPASFAPDTNSHPRSFNLNATPSLTHTMSATPGGASASAPVSLFAQKFPRTPPI